MRNVFTMLALLGTTIAPSLATESNGVGARGRATPVGSQRLETMSAVEFRQFVRSGNQWEDRTKTWQNHETAMTPMSTSRITKLWAVAEVGSIRLRTSDLRDRQPRIVLMFGNDGLFAMHGMAPGDTMYAVLQMEERSDAIEAFGVVVAQSGRIFVHSLGRPQVCYRWRPAATELSYPSFISGRSCDPSVEDPHNAATLEKPPAPQTIDLSTPVTGESEADYDAPAPFFIPTLRASASPPGALARTANVGLPSHDWNCTGGFTCAEGTCGVAFPDGHAPPRELK